MALATMLLFASAVSAVTADLAPSALNLSQLIELARRDNKNLQAARFVIDISRARLLQTGLRANPRLGISARSDFLFGNDGEHGGALSLSEDFPIAGRLLREKDVARVDVALAETEVADAERHLAGEVAADVYRVLILDRQIAARSALIEIETGLAATTRERYKAAEVSELDVNTIEIDRQRLLQERALAQGQREQRLLSLNTRLGRAAATPLQIDEPLPKLDALPGLPKLQAQALEHRADLRGALLAADRARAEQALAHASRWQDWTLSLELAQDKQVIIGAPPQGTSHSIGVSVSIPLPLFNKGQGMVEAAQASEGQAQAKIDSLRLDINSEVAGAHAEATRLQSVLGQYAQQLLPISANNVSLAQQGYRQGLIPIFDVVQVQRQQAELNTIYLQTLDQYLQALVRLHTAVGDYLKD